MGATNISNQNGWLKGEVNLQVFEISELILHMSLEL